MITVNSVFKYIDIENGERIKVINIEANEVYIVNIDTATSMPQKENLDKINEEIEIKKLIEIKDPFVRIIEDKELSKVEMIKRNEDWNFICKYWKENKN